MNIRLLTTGGTIAMQASATGANLGVAPAFAQMLTQALPDIAVPVQPAHQEFGRNGGQGHRNDHHEDVQQAFLHGSVTTRFVDLGAMKGKMGAVKRAYE